MCSLLILHDLLYFGQKMSDRTKFTVKEANRANKWFIPFSRSLNPVVRPTSAYNSSFNFDPRRTSSYNLNRSKKELNRFRERCSDTARWAETTTSAVRVIGAACVVGVAVAAVAVSCNRLCHRRAGAAATVRQNKACHLKQCHPPERFLDVSH